MPPQFRKENNICCTALEFVLSIDANARASRNHFEREVKMQLQTRSASKSNLTYRVEQ